MNPNKRHMRLRSLQEHALLPCGTASVSRLQTRGGTEQHGGGRGRTERGGQRGRKRQTETERDRERAMASGVLPSIPMRRGLRYRGRGQKIDSFWRKWAPVCPLGFWEAWT